MFDIQPLLALRFIEVLVNLYLGQIETLSVLSAERLLNAVSRVQAGYQKSVSSISIQVSSL